MIHQARRRRPATLLLAGLLAGAAVPATAADAAWPATGTGTTSGSASPLPGAPGYPSLLPLSCVGSVLTVQISWTAATNAGSYTVFRQFSGQASTPLTTTTGTTATDSFTVGGYVSYTVQSALGTWTGPTAGPVVAPLSC